MYFNSEGNTYSVIIVPNTNRDKVNNCSISGEVYHGLVHVPSSLCSLCHLFQVRVWAPPDQVNQGRFALYVAVKVLQYYEEIFQVDYPLPKQGMEPTDKL